MDFDDLDFSRQAERDQIDTDVDDAAYESASYWRALRRHGVPWPLAAVLVIRAQTTSAVVVRGVADGGEG